MDALRSSIGAETRKKPAAVSARSRGGRRKRKGGPLTASADVAELRAGPVQIQVLSRVESVLKRKKTI
jgi:hypothetical protein